MGNANAGAGRNYRHAHVYVLALFLVVFAGFFKTYFTRLGQAGFLQHLHAATAIGWMGLLVAQSWTISHGRVILHRALAKLSFRPRSYQMVPLIMALRQESVRLLIADDVGNAIWRVTGTPTAP